MSTKKYIVVRVQSELTYWTNPEAPKGKPTAVNKKKATEALKSARSAYPHFTYKLEEVKEKSCKSTD